MYITAVALTISFRLLPSSADGVFMLPLLNHGFRSRSQIQHKVIGWLTKMT